MKSEGSNSELIDVIGIQESTGASYSCYQPGRGRKYKNNGIINQPNPVNSNGGADEEEIIRAASKYLGRVVSKIKSGVRKQGIVESYDVENEWFKIIYPNQDWEYIFREDLPNIIAHPEVADAFLNGLRAARPSENPAFAARGGGGVCVAHAGGFNAASTRGRKRGSTCSEVQAKPTKARKKAEDPKNYVPLALREKAIKRNEYYWNWC